VCSASWYAKVRCALPDVIHLFFSKQKEKVEPKEGLVGVKGFVVSLRSLSASA
jgi:hypothetical protein